MPNNKEEKTPKKNSAQALATCLRDFSNSVKLDVLYSKGGQLDIIKHIIKHEKFIEIISIHLSTSEKFKECVYKKAKNFSGLTKAWIEDVYRSEFSAKTSSKWYADCDAVFSQDPVVAETPAERKKDILQKFNNIRINWPKIWVNHLPRKTLLNRKEPIFDSKVKSELKEISKIMENFVANIKKIETVGHSEYTDDIQDDLIDSYGEEFKVALREFRDFMLQEGKYENNGKSFSALCLNKNSLFILKKFSGLMEFTKENSGRFSFTKKWIDQVSNKLEKFCKGIYQKSLKEYRATVNEGPTISSKDAWEHFQQSCEKEWQKIWKMSLLKKFLPGRVNSREVRKLIDDIAGAF